ncbi:MAG TPA: CAP domain-containing protein [Clostridia bacterium]|nr:CAP domain-containing protein [Clostridia bacterium]
MKKSLLIFIIMLTLFVGFAATPAMANSNITYNPYANEIGSNYNVVNISHGNLHGLLIRLNNWYINYYDGSTIIEKPEAPEPDSVPVVPAPEPKPVVPAPEPKPVTPAPEPKPVTPAPEPKPVTPAPEPKPVTPAPEPKPVTPAPEPKPATPAPEPKPVTPAPEPKSDPIPTPPQGIGSQQTQMLNAVNQERVKVGVKPLQWDGKVAGVAQVKAKDMVDNNYFSHTSPSYGSPFDMLKSHGVSYRAAGENLAGSSSVERAQIGLMNSEGHKKNILNSSFTHLGIGVEKSSKYGYVYVQMFIGK